MKMIPCEGGERHHAHDDMACPFCAEKTKHTPLRTKALRIIGGAATTLVLAACYGPAGIDADGDGYTSCDDRDDCDDTEETINPGLPRSAMTPSTTAAMISSKMRTTTAPSDSGAGARPSLEPAFSHREGQTLGVDIGV
ncbi:MAG: hypothetical protein ACI9MC_000740 [Kiritimatiellia bacterium]|jgi:hypothetical protein